MKYMRSAISYFNMFIRMKLSVFLITGVIISYAASAQKADPVSSIIEEGKLLYRLHMASWKGTELLLNYHREQSANTGGYFSYEQNEHLHCVFFSKDETPKVITTFTFDTTFQYNTARKDIRVRDFTPAERTTYTIWKKALEEVANDTTFFALYRNTNLVLIPVSDQFRRKVYVITIPLIKGMVLFGNDYLLEFDQKDSLVNKRALHAGIIPLDHGKDTDPDLIETFHLHPKETGKFITPTDICILMLNRDAARWKEHVVISKSHASVWDYGTNSITVLTKEAWNRQNANKKLVSVKD